MKAVQENIHDNNILSYIIDLKNRFITINTEYDNKEIITIIFRNIMGHCFHDEYENINNYIFEIEENTIEEFINSIGNENFTKYIIENKIQLYGSTVYVDNLNNVRNWLKENKQKCYWIKASVGISGWILAEEMQIIVENKKIK